MEKILIFGDIHIHSHKSYNFFTLLSFQILDYIKFYCKKEGIENVVFLGDLFENRMIIKTEDAVETKKKFYSFKNEENLKLYAVVGNHDSVYESDISVNSVSLYQEYFNEFSHKENFYKLKKLSNDFVDFYILNYSPKKTIKKTKLNENKLNILFTHNDIYGSPLQNGTYLKQGLDIDFFKSFNLVFNGHIHNRAEFANVIQVGSPYKYAINELNTESGFYVLTLDNNSFSYEIIKLDFLPKLLTLKVTEAKSDFYKEELEKMNIENDFLMLEIYINDLSYINNLKNFIMTNFEVVDVFIDILAEFNKENNETKELSEVAKDIKETQNFIKEIKTTEGFIESIKNYLIEKNYYKKDDKELDEKILFLKKIIEYKRG